MVIISSSANINRRLCRFDLHNMEAVFPALKIGHLPVVDLSVHSFLPPDFHHDFQRALKKNCKENELAYIFRLSVNARTFSPEKRKAHLDLDLFHSPTKLRTYVTMSVPFV